MASQPASWTTAMERDLLQDTLPSMFTAAAVAATVLADAALIGVIDSTAQHTPRVAMRTTYRKPMY